MQGAAFIGAFGAPFIFVSGGDAVCNEASRFVPGILAAVVKHAEGRNKAYSLPRKEADTLIYNTARASVAFIKKLLRIRSIYLPRSFSRFSVRIIATVLPQDTSVLTHILCANFATALIFTAIFYFLYNNSVRF